MAHVRQALGTICAALVLLFCTSARAEMAWVVAPYVQDVRSDGFTVAFETVDEVAAEVHAGGIVVATHGRRHEARLRGLGAAARTVYRVFVGGRDVGGGEVALPGDKPTLDFVVYGDTRDGGDAEAALVRLAAGEHPDLILHTGDFAPHGADLAGWLRFFAAEGPLLRDVPLYPTLGNHEIFHDPGARHFRRFFVMPDGGRERLYYRFRVGPALFIVLDGNSATPAQTAWLGAELEEARRQRVPHVFVLVHQPPLSVGEHCGSAVDEADWVALFEKYRVRAVFAGHDHAYERMERNGVRYFVSGGGGAPVYAERRSCAPFDLAARRVYRPVHHLLAVHVDGGNVEVRALPLDGGPPLEVSRFADGEPRFAENAPPLLPRTTAATPPWSMAGGAVLFVLLGVLLRRKRTR